jgi:uncharacterized phage protein (TIGR01671 family)
MREILFRGKSLKDNEWTEGYYCRYGHIGKEKDYIIPDYASALWGVEVDSNTIGQFTGLTDKNGVKIFEGDIVRHYCKLPVPGGEIGTDRGTIKWDSEECFFFRTSLDGKDKTISAKCEYEIIGNIYDNPELIDSEMIGGEADD